jgi:hypothetical protein
MGLLLAVKGMKMLSVIMTIKALMLLTRQASIFLLAREGKFVVDLRGLIWHLGFGICAENKGISY